jgi:hypothetical protein
MVKRDRLFLYCNNSANGLCEAGLKGLNETAQGYKKQANYCF